MTSAASAGGASSLSGTSHNKEPAAALDPIATNAGVAKITKEFAAVDFDHTKAEVVHAVERLGEVIAGGLSGIGAAHEGRDLPAINEFWAKKGSASASSAFGKPLHDAETSISSTSQNAGTGSNGVTPFQGGIAGFSSAAAAWPPTGNSAATTAGTAGLTGAGPSSTGSTTAALAKDGSSASAPTLPPVTGGPALYPTDKSAPAAIKIEEPQATPQQARAETARDGAHAPALNSNNVGGASTTASTGSNNATHATPAAAAAAVPVAVGSSTDKAPASASTATTDTSAATTSAAPLAGHSVPHDNKKPSVIQDLKAGLKGDHKAADHDPSGPMIGPPVVAKHEAEGLIDKKHPTGLGVASGANTAGGPPVTPKKTAAGAMSTAGTPATPQTDAYNTAPSTPSGTPNDRKRKSSM